MPVQVPTSHKAVALAEELKAELAMRLAGVLAITAEGFDTDMSPWFRVGTDVLGTDGMLVKVRPVSWPLARDVLGLSSTIFTPHVIQIVVEDVGGLDDLGIGTTNAQSWLTLQGVLLMKGTRVEIYADQNDGAGNKPGLDEILAANLVASFEGHIQYPMVASQ